MQREHKMYYVPELLAQNDTGAPPPLDDYNKWFKSTGFNWNRFFKGPKQVENDFHLRLNDKEMNQNGNARYNPYANTG